MLFDDHGEGHAAHLFDVSRSGFRLRSAEPFEPGDFVRMTVDGHDFGYQIRWSAKSGIGSVFRDLTEVSAGFSGPIPANCMPAQRLREHLAWRGKPQTP